MAILGDLGKLIDGVDAPILYGRELNEGEIDLKFPKRYGVEMEFEGEEGVPFSDIQEMLDDRCLRVVGDGSLTEDGGFEVVSKPLDSTTELYDFMSKTLTTLRNKMEIHTIGSPIAIHIHVSNVKEPGNLFYLMEYFGDVFEHLRKRHDNLLVHNRLRRPHYGVVKDIIQIERKKGFKNMLKDDVGYYFNRKINPLLANESLMLGDIFMNGLRRCTLRYSGFDSNKRTLEFRVFPHIYRESIYRIYIQIVNAMVYFAEENSLESIYKLTSKKSPLYLKLMAFQEICGLKDIEMSYLFNGSMAEGAKFEQRCRCDPPITMIEHYPLWIQPGDAPQECGPEEHSIYGCFGRVYRRRGRIYAEIALRRHTKSGNERHTNAVVVINDRDLKFARTYGGEWFHIFGENFDFLPRYIPRCFVKNRHYHLNESVVFMSFPFNEKLYTVFLSGEEYIQMEEMWNESIVWAL